MTEQLVEGMDSVQNPNEETFKKVTKRELEKLRAATNIEDILANFDGLWESGRYSVEFERVGPTKDENGKKVQLGWMPNPEFEGHKVDKQYIFDRFGGGDYKIQIRGPRYDEKQGGFKSNRVVLIKSGVFRISGDPVSPSFEEAAEQALETAKARSDPQLAVIEMLKEDARRRDDEARRRDEERRLEMERRDAERKEEMRLLRDELRQERESAAQLKLEASKAEGSMLNELVSVLKTDKNTAMGMIGKSLEGPRRNEEDANLTAEIVRGSNTTATEMQREHREALSELSRNHAQQIADLRESADRRERDAKDRYDERIRAADQAWQSRLDIKDSEVNRYREDAKDARDKYDALVIQLQDAKVEAAKAQAANPAGGGDLSSLEGFAQTAEKLKAVSGILGMGTGGGDPTGADKYIAIANAAMPIAEKVLGSAGSVAGKILAARAQGQAPQPDPNAMAAWQAARGQQRQTAPQPITNPSPGLPAPPQEQEAPPSVPNGDLPTSLASDPIMPLEEEPMDVVGDMEENSTGGLTPDQYGKLKLLFPMLETAMSGSVEPAQFAAEVSPLLDDEVKGWIQQAGPTETINLLKEANNGELGIQQRSYLRKALKAMGDSNG